MLLDERTDSKNHVTHLIITKAQRSDLLHQLNTAFGQKLDEENQNYIVSSATILRRFLSDKWKSADKPWD